MDESHNHDQGGSARLYAIGVSVVAALLAAALGQGAMVWRDNAVLADSMEKLQRAVDTNTLTLRSLAEQAHSNSIHRVEHEKQADRWIDKIIENERGIHALQQSPSARPDPFTGTDGRRLEKRIEYLESRGSKRP